MSEDTHTVLTYDLMSLTPVAGWCAVYHPDEGNGDEVFTCPVFALATARVSRQEFDYRGRAQGPLKEECTDIVGVIFDALDTPQFRVADEDANYVGLLPPESNLAEFCRARGLPTPGVA